MLATDECLNLEEYAFKSSPESCSGTSYFTDYTDLPSDEDFLQQLSSDLDIPLLLNPGEDEMSLLNSFLDKSPSEIMSEIAIPLSDDNDDKFDEIAEEFSELQQLDMLKCKPKAFQTVQTEIKLEPMDCNSSNSSGSEKSDSPIPRSDQTIFELKHEMKSEPLSPCSITTSPIHSIDSNIIISTIPNKHQFSPHNPIGVTKLAPKRVAIQPKTPYAIPSNKTSKMVLFKNSGNNIQSSTRSPKVVVLENVTAVPVKNVAQLTSPNSINNQINNRTVSPVFLKNNNLAINVGNIDPKAFKRQQRKIKNRESACLSRKKKKDYLTSLENQVKDLATENQKLKLQNLQLQERLAKYEGKYLGNGGLNNNNNTNNHNSSNNVKNSIVLCIFLFSLGFHLDYIRNPFSINNQMSVKQTDKIKVLDHHGRNLLWVQQEDTSEKNSSNFLPFSMCPASINQTESARLVLELERWIGKPKDSVDKTPPLNTTKLNKYNAKPRLRKRKLKKYDNSLISSVYSLSSTTKKVASDSNNNEIQVFSHEQIYSEFFEAINRQDDTFYVVSFSDHHMLLPALHHNKTRRPKMSLIMPSMLPNTNSSKPLTYVPLMQIDCEVLDTRLIQIRYGSIPQHLREQGNSTTYQDNDNSNGDVSKSSDSTAANNYTQKKAYRPYFIKQGSVKPNDQSDLAL